MADKRLYLELRERAWRRRLTPSEYAQLRRWLAVHPEDLADWETEVALNESLTRLPDVEVPNNFTSLVLQAAQRESRWTSAKRRWPRLAWLPRIAFACLVAGLGILTYQQVQESERQDVVRTVSVLSEVAAVPSPEVLKDFEAIRVLDRTPPADEELLRLLQ